MVHGAFRCVSRSPLLSGLECISPKANINASQPQHAEQSRAPRGPCQTHNPCQSELCFFCRVQYNSVCTVRGHWDLRTIGLRLERADRWMTSPKANYNKSYPWYTETRNSSQIDGWLCCREHYFLSVYLSTLRRQKDRSTLPKSFNNGIIRACVKLSDAPWDLGQCGWGDIENPGFLGAETQLNYCKLLTE